MVFLTMASFSEQSDGGNKRRSEEEENGGRPSKRPRLGDGLYHDTLRQNSNAPLSQNQRSPDDRMPDTDDFFFHCAW